MRYDLRALARRGGIRRSGIDLRPIEPTTALASQLETEAFRILRAAHEEIRGRLLTVYAPRPVQTQDDASSTIADALAAVSNAIRRLVVNIAPGAARWAVRVEQWHRQRFAATIRAGTGADIVAFLTAQDAQDEVEAAVSWAASLIEGLTDDLRRQVENLTWAAYANQTPREELARDLTQRIGTSRARARFIARDQTTKLAANLDRLRQQEAGITEYRWRHSGKKHPRPEHVARDGHIFRWDDAPADGHPGTQPNCFPSGEPVWFHDDVKRIWRRWHSADLTTIVTKAGETVRCTPNHPVLTASGWKPAQTVDVGDDLVRVSLGALHASEMQEIERQPRIGDLFQAAQALLGSVSFNASRGDFHSDAAGDEDVDVVNAERGLTNDIESGLLKLGRQIGLEAPAITQRALDAFRSTLSIGGRPLHPSHGIVGWGGSLASLLWREALHDDGRGVATAAHINRVASEHLGNAVAAYAEAIAQRIDALPGLVSTDRRALIVLAAVVSRSAHPLRVKPAPRFEVLGERVAAEAERRGHVAQEAPGLHLRYGRVESVVTRAWQGHVFNLETASGWYNSRGFAVRNCGCRAQAHLTLE